MRLRLQVHHCAAGTHGKDKVKLGGARSKVKLAADCNIVNGALQAEVMLSCCSNKQIAWQWNEADTQCQLEIMIAGSGSFAFCLKDEMQSARLANRHALQTPKIAAIPVDKSQADEWAQRHRPTRLKLYQ